MLIDDEEDKKIHRPVTPKEVNRFPVNQMDGWMIDFFFFFFQINVWRYAITYNIY